MLVIGLVFLIPLFACGQVFNAIVLPQIQHAAAQLIPDRQTENQQKLSIVLEEAQALPLYPYGTETTSNVSSGEGNSGVYREVVYYASTSCAEVQDYYATALPAASWKPVDRSDVSSISPDYVQKFYQKTVDKHRLQLYVGCYESNAQYVTHLEAL